MNNSTSKFDKWLDDWTEDVSQIAEAVSARIKYGDPPLFDATTDVGISPRAAMNQKRERIKRRRELLGLPYQEYTGKLQQ